MECGGLPATPIVCESADHEQARRASLSSGAVPFQHHFASTSPSIIDRDRFAKKHKPGHGFADELAFRFTKKHTAELPQGQMLPLAAIGAAFDGRCEDSTSCVGRLGVLVLCAFSVRRAQGSRSYR
jgi:hypothetical protein